VLHKKEDSATVTWSQLRDEYSCNNSRGISLLLMIRGCWIVFNVLLLRLTPNVEESFVNPPCVFWHRKLLSIPEAARFKAWVCGRSFAGIVGSNSAGDMAICLV